MEVEIVDIQGLTKFRDSANPNLRRQPACAGNSARVLVCLRAPIDSHVVLFLVHIVI